MKRTLAMITVLLATALAGFVLAGIAQGHELSGPNPTPDECSRTQLTGPLNTNPACVGVHVIPVV